MHSKQCLFMVSYLNHRWLSTNFCNFCWVILEFNKVVCQDHLSETQFYCRINNKFQKKIRQDMWKGTFRQTAPVIIIIIIYFQFSNSKQNCRHGKIMNSHLVPFVGLSLTLFVDYDYFGFSLSFLSLCLSMSFGFMLF